MKFLIVENKLKTEKIVIKILKNPIHQLDLMRIFALLLMKDVL